MKNIKKNSPLNPKPLVFAPSAAQRAMDLEALIRGPAPVKRKRENDIDTVDQDSGALRRAVILSQAIPLRTPEEHILFLQKIAAKEARLRLEERLRASVEEENSLFDLYPMDPPPPPPEPLEPEIVIISSASLSWNAPE